MSMFDKIFKAFGFNKPQEPEVNNEVKASEYGTKPEAENMSDEIEAKAESTEAKAESEAEKAEANTDGEKSRIYNLLIVDESGSMSHLRQSTLSGINETLNTIRSAQKEFADTQEHYVTLVTFDSGGNRHDVRTIIDCEPIGNVGEFNDYQPNGCTPLYDAMGNSIVQLQSKMKGDPKATALVTVLTDGLENSSREWDAKAVRQLIERLTEEGWSFSYMGSAHDVKSVTDLLSIHNVMEFSHDDLGSANTWERERGSKMAYYRKMSAMKEEEQRRGIRFSINEMVARKRQFAKEYFADRVTPEQVVALNENEIFVFGSNPEGNHNGGAAKYALDHFGAVMGQGEGLQGRCYAIPTTGSMESIRKAIHRFIRFVDEHPEKRFLVTRIGCGTAGHSARDIAPLFRLCIPMENVALPKEFWNHLGLKMIF